jgi:FkbM family methyltransferase
MQFFGRRSKPAVPDAAVSKPNLLDEIHEKSASIYGKIVAIAKAIKGIGDIETELRQVRLQLDFVRTRIGCYVGDGVALTYLADETPLFVNANDMGGPFNLLNGGRYEEENFEALLSFVKDDTAFLDIGANLGIYTLRMGRRIGREGKVYSFEPHPKLNELLSRNVHINGLSERVHCFKLGLSDQNSTATFQYPIGHLGGGHVGGSGSGNGHIAVEAEIRRLDDLLGDDFCCDLVKIDVEGHEINVLNGMKRIVQNSPSIKILFEKLMQNAGTEVALESYFSELGFELYGVRPDASLVLLRPGGLVEWDGYVFAARPGTIEGGLHRARFSLYGGQLFKPNAPTPTPGVLQQSAAEGEMLFHGPYWFLRTGVWRFKFHGEIHGAVRIRILERFGYHVLNFLIEQGNAEHVFVMPRDLVYFECAAYAASPQTDITLQRLEFIREG